MNQTSPIFIDKIFSKKYINPELMDVHSLLVETESPEAHALVTRLSQASNWVETFPQADLLALWIGWTFFFYSHIQKSVSREMLGERFICIAFNTFDLDDGIPPVPSVYIANAKQKTVITEQCEDSTSEEMRKIKAGFHSCGLDAAFEFFESRGADPSGDTEVIWIYSIAKDTSKCANPSLQK